MTQHQALYGLNSKLLLPYILGVATIEKVDLALIDRQKMQQL